MYLKTFKNTVTDFIPNQYLCFELMFVYIEYKIHLYILSCSMNNKRVHQGVSHPLFLLMWLGETLTEMYSKFCCSEDKLEKHILYLHSSLHFTESQSISQEKYWRAFFKNQNSYRHIQTSMCLEWVGSSAAYQHSAISDSGLEYRAP